MEAVASVWLPVILPLYDSGECGGTKVTKLDAGKMRVGGYRTTFPDRQFSNSLPSFRCQLAVVHVNAWPWEPGMDFRESLKFIKDSPLSSHPQINYKNSPTQGKEI